MTLSSLRPLPLALALVLGCTGCEGTLGPGDAPNSRELFQLYGLDEGPNSELQLPRPTDHIHRPIVPPPRERVTIADVGSLT